MLNTILCIELTPQIAADVFYNGEMEAKPHRFGLIQYRCKSDSDWKECGFDHVKYCACIVL